MSSTVVSTFPVKSLVRSNAILCVLVRDQARREALKADGKKERNGVKSQRPQSARRWSESDMDRDELMAMVNVDCYSCYRAFD